MNLINDAPDARLWVNEQFERLSVSSKVGDLVSAVIWTDTYLQDGEPIGGDDPSVIVDSINRSGLPLLHGPDPGRPAGRLISARAFQSQSGTRFVAAIIGYYTPQHALTFEALGVDPYPARALPHSLPNLVDVSFQLAFDSRDFPPSWLEEVLADKSISLQKVDLSLNSAETLRELLRIALPYAVLVWNPSVKAIGEQAGKDIYSAFHAWLGNLLKKLQRLKAPVLEVQANYANCTVAFLFRTKEVDQQYAAHSALATSAAQAAQLIENFGKKGKRLERLNYEFESGRWYPSYAITTDGRVISDPSLLIAYEQVPRYLSMGMVRREVNES